MTNNLAVQQIATGLFGGNNAMSVERLPGRQNDHVPGGREGKRRGDV
jgi:hypothetical protein